MSRSPARRPTLLPSVRRLWRGANQLQLGTDPGRAVMLELTDPASARILDLLDGSRTEQALLRETARLAIPPEDVHSLLDKLRQAGYVMDATALRPAGCRRLGAAVRRRVEHEAVALALRRRPGSPGTPAARLRRRLSAQVMITGASQLAIPIATALTAAGVGHLEPVIFTTPDDNDSSALEALRRAAPLSVTPPARRDRVTFAVLVGVAAPASLTALAYRRVAHLAVSVRDATVVVGPVVRPGLSPCLNCLDLHRVDRDPAWRLVAAQLSDSGEPDPVASTTLLAAAAFAAEEVLMYLDGGTPRTLGATVEIAAPGESARRLWSPHPACGCARRQRSHKTKPPVERA